MDRFPGKLVTAVGLLLAIAALKLGRPVLMPLALALLLSFCLAPAIDRLERRGLARVPSVIAVCLLIFALLGGVGFLVAREASFVAADFPKYRTNLREKVRELRGPIRSLSGAAEEINKLGEEIEATPDLPPGAPQPPKVEVVEPARPLGTIGEVLTPLLGTLGTVGLVLVLALFMLLEREELRDRLIWLAGAQDLSLTTRAIDDGARRVSRYLGMQSLLCAIHGCAVAAGLLLIGVPAAVLWGALAALLRFLPYFGPWIAAVLPLAIALTLPGWEPALLTFFLLVTLELVSNNVLEPLFYGSSAGLSPFGVIFAAIFWASLWGIPGLLLATPLTVCLVVAGRHLHELEYFSVLLGDRPALSPETRFYQRMLALDADEATDVLRDAAAGADPEQVADSVVLPALRRLAEDAHRGAFSDVQLAAVLERLSGLIDGVFAELAPVAPARPGPRVLFAPALDEAEALAGRWLARMLEARGVAASAASVHALSSELIERAEAEADLVCISALTPRAIAHARRLCKRLEERGLQASVVVGCWARPAEELAGEAGAASSDGRLRWIVSAADLRAPLEEARLRASSGDSDEPVPRVEAARG